jgi:hypothetical protein
LLTLNSSAEVLGYGKAGAPGIKAMWPPVVACRLGEGLQAGLCLIFLVLQSWKQLHLWDMQATVSASFQ